MEISDVLNKEVLTTIVINELKTYGVKYQKGKKKKALQSKTCYKHIFRTHMHLMELTDVILASGKVVQIPKFVADSCNRILEQVETEGLFRKAGSFARQKEIRLNLEAGAALGKTHHVIDVANVIKYFFRELPEPLIPPNIQETFLQSFLIGENSINAILLSCLLLPTISINTLSFFMQFLYTVSLNQNYNKMSIENLAIIFTPGIMPYPNINSHRFSNNVKIISILIENSTGIGAIPDIIKRKIEQSSPLSTTEPNALFIPRELNNSLQNETKEYSTKKKKRRSDMFNGLKRIVGTAMGSSEFLDHTPSENKHNVRHMKTNGHKSKHSDNNKTFIMEIKKRKIEDAMSAISTKKKSSKTSRLSFGGNRQSREISSNPVISMERRWSVVGSGWTKSKNKSNNSDVKAGEFQNNKSGDQINDATAYEVSPNLTKNAENGNSLENNDICTQISKNDYEEIKERVVAIEAHISSAFAVFQNSVIADKLSGPEQDQTQYERRIVETEDLLSPATEYLAQRLNCGLKIRQSIDHCVIRSPSARKIDTIRRRSLDKALLSRNSTWNVLSKNIVCEESKPYIAMENVSSSISTKSLNSKNKVSPYKSSQQCSLSPSRSRQKNNLKGALPNINNHSNEKWIPGVDFFSSIKTKHTLYKGYVDSLNQPNFEHIATPVGRKNNSDLCNTPNVPTTPCAKKVFTPSNVMSTYINRTEETSGRASIARLRTQNAGMVMAKAKLFDGLEECHSKEFQLLKSNQYNINKSEFLNKCTEKRQKSFFTDGNILIIEPNKNILQSKVESTPIARRIHNINLNSPISSSQRRQCASKYIQKQVISTVITDENLIKRHNLNEHPFISEKEINLNVNRKIFTTSYPCKGKSSRVVKDNRVPSKLRTTSSGN